MKKMSEEEKEYAIICNSGFEDIAALEVKDITGAKTNIRESCVLFSTSEEKAIEYCYNAQAPKKILLVLGKGRNAMQVAESIDTAAIKGSFALRSNKKNSEREIAEIIYNKLDDPKVNLDNPDCLLYLHQEKSNALIGIDVTQTDLSKRSYKIFSHPTSLKGTLAYYLVKMSLMNNKPRKGVFLDPCAGSGTIVAEAAFLSSGLSPRFFDKEELFSKHFDDELVTKITKKLDEKIEKKLPCEIRAYDVDLQSVNAMKKNFKIGGVENYIQAAKGDIDWLDTKFEKESVDWIVSQPPQYNKFNEKSMDKFYDKFFYQTEFVLRKKGVITIISNSEKPIEHATKYKLNLKKRKSFKIGAHEKHIFEFGK